MTSVRYWQSYAPQIHAYATAKPYDTETEQRSEWPWPIDATHGLIAHLDVRAAVDDGEARCTLVHVDLTAGAECADVCRWVDEWENRSDVFTVADAPTAVPVLGRGAQLAAVPDAPAEGDDVDEAEWADLRALYAALDDASRSWIGALASEAQRALVPWWPKDVKTRRRFDILRGLVELAGHESADNEVVRGIVANAVGADWPWFRNVTCGHAVGAMSADEAARFAALCQSFTLGHVSMHVDDAGRSVVQEVAA